jgi:drug/metabolite transporter (DMT)-like permease
VPLSAFALALGAAVLHAGWNAYLARAADIFATTAVVLALSVALAAPAAAATWHVEVEAIPWIVLSAGLEAVYFVLLAAAYRRSDLSLVYPVARGAAPVLVLAGAAAAGTVLDPWQAVGVVLVGLGIFLVRGPAGSADRRGIGLALTIAAVIAGYTLADAQGIEHASPVAYLELVLVPVALGGIAWQLATGRLSALRAATTRGAVGASVASFSAYALVLAALSRAPAPAVAAVRETSILFAVALGALVLGEPVGRQRAAGAAVVVAGTALVALG